MGARCGSQSGALTAPAGEFKLIHQIETAVVNERVGCVAPAVRRSYGRQILRISRKRIHLNFPNKKRAAHRQPNTNSISKLFSGVNGWQASSLLCIKWFYEVCVNLRLAKRGILAYNIVRKQEGKSKEQKKANLKAFNKDKAEKKFFQEKKHAPFHGL